MPRRDAWSPSGGGRGAGREGTRRRDHVGTALLAAAGAAVLLLAVAHQRLTATSEARDPVTLCPVSGARGVTVVLVDRTDFLTLAQREDLRRRLRALAEEVPADTALALYAVGPPLEPGQLPAPVFRRCNPGRGDDANPWLANPARMRRRWEEGFARPAQAAIDGLLEPHVAAHSPIMEAIQLVAIAALREARPGAPRRLVVVSDLLQHTPEFSHYRQVADFRAFEQTPYFRRVWSELRDVTVTVLYLRRDGQHGRQGRAHIEFWQQYFAALGATLAGVVSVQG